MGAAVEAERVEAGMSIRLIAYLSAAAIAAVCIAYGIGRWQGSAAERRACEAELHAAELTAERQARDAERKAQEAQNGIIQDYEHQIADYRRTVDAYVDTDRLSDIVPVQTCPQRPALSPALSAIPEPTYREKLRRVWLLPQSATSSPSDTGR